MYINDPRPGNGALRTNCPEIASSLRDWEAGSRWRTRKRDYKGRGKAIFQGFIAHLVNQGSILPGTEGVSGPQEVNTFDSEQFFDNLSGEWLRPALVHAARS